MISTGQFHPQLFCDTFVLSSTFYFKTSIFFSLPLHSTTFFKTASDVLGFVSHIKYIFYKAQICHLFLCEHLLLYMPSNEA